MDTKTFRMETLQAMEHYLQDEIRTRQSLKKKYLYLKNSFAVLNYTLLVVSLVAGATGVLVSPGIILSAVTSSVSIVSMICPALAKKMQSKSKKHSAIQNLAEEKLNTVYCHISKALNDDFISDEEFKQVYDDIESYRCEKGNIISQHKKTSVLMQSLTEHFEEQVKRKVTENID